MTHGSFTFTPASFSHPHAFCVLCQHCSNQIQMLCFSHSCEDDSFRTSFVESPSKANETEDIGSGAFYMLHIIIPGKNQHLASSSNPFSSSFTIPFTHIRCLQCDCLTHTSNRSPSNRYMFMSDGACTRYMIDDTMRWWPCR